MARQTPTTNPKDRFMMYVNKTDTCWFWTGGVFQSNGRPRFWLDGRYALAYNVSYQWWGSDEFDTTLTRDHLCRNILCVNPSHLEQVTTQENIRRYRETRTTCPSGHEYDGLNRYGYRTCSECRRRAVRKHRAKSTIKVGA